MTYGTFKGLSTPISNVHFTSGASHTSGLERKPGSPGPGWTSYWASDGLLWLMHMAITQSQEEAATPSQSHSHYQCGPAAPVPQQSGTVLNAAGPTLCSYLCCPLLRVESIKMACRLLPSSGQTAVKIKEEQIICPRPVLGFRQLRTS